MTKKELKELIKEVISETNVDKSVNEDWKDKAKAIGLAGALVGLPVGISKYAPTLRHNGEEYKRAMYHGDKSKLKKMAIDGKEVYVFHMGTGKKGRDLGWGYMPVEK